MAKNREKMAALLGAKIVGEVPDVGGGAFGMARLARILHERLTLELAQRPTSSNHNSLHKSCETSEGIGPSTSL